MQNCEQTFWRDKAWKQLRSHNERLCRALEAQAARLIAVQRENRRLKAIIGPLGQENRQLRDRQDAAVRALAA